MNAQLRKAYEAFYLRVGSRLRDKSLANPLFIDYDESDETAGTKKIMVFGKETNNWQDAFGKTLVQLLSAYSEFYNQKDAKGTRNCYRMPGPFWNECGILEGEFRKKCPDIKIIWNNILKIGVYGRPGSPDDQHIKLYMADTAALIRTELEIIKPHAVLFLTGPNYDRHIQSVFYDAQLMPANYSIDVELLARIKSEFLPKKAIRTFHPQELSSVLEKEYEMDKEKFREIVVGSVCL